MPTLTVNKRLTIDFEDRTPVIDLDVGSEITFGCRSGKCGICAIKITRGEENASPRNDEENELLDLLGETDALVRLACQCVIFGNVDLETVE